jgi:hypothetical protein
MGNFATEIPTALLFLIPMMAIGAPVLITVVICEAWKEKNNKSIILIEKQIELEKLKQSQS